MWVSIFCCIEDSKDCFSSKVVGCICAWVIMSVWVSMEAVSIGKRIVESGLAHRNTKLVNSNTLKGPTKTSLFFARLLVLSCS